jgi:hypothetical protein
MANQIPTVKISLVSADDKTELPSTRVGDKVYFHAEPETAFTVKYDVQYPAYVSPQYNKILVELTIDGESVGYAKKATPTAWKSGVFEGFYKAVDNTK